jgi:Mycothiol maleylpyruvate isomerase N-terminal domain
VTDASGRILGSFLEMAARVEGILGSKAVAERWEDPSALEGYTVAGLSGHLARGVLTVEEYVTAPGPPPHVDATDAAGYMTAVLGTHDPLHSDLHRSVRARSSAASEVGVKALEEDVRRARQRLSRLLTASTMDRRIEVFTGVVLTVEEYLRTRLVELVVHFDDLSFSVGEDNAEGLPQDAYEEVAIVLMQVALRRNGGLSVVRSLARRERHPEAIRAL